jgi:hypothetical protein
VPFRSDINIEICRGKITPKLTPVSQKLRRGHYMVGLLSSEREAPRSG